MYVSATDERRGTAEEIVTENKMTSPAHKVWDIYLVWGPADVGYTVWPEVSAAHIRWSNVILMLSRRLRRRPKIYPTLSRACWVVSANEYSKFSVRLIM